ncbi:MAG: acyl-CoA/acyl-ACP dehydrogenase [Acidobacteriota bacterium]|nr:acyl-CoA/acyl-ACP dehydrogenase [Acidobacteriota bacterium]
MQFAFDDRQVEFRAQLRALAEKECTPADLRAAWESAPGWSADRWRALGDMGILAVTVPEAQGGLGLGFVDLVLLLEEAGRSGLPEPVVETVAVAAPLFAALGTDASGRWLEGIASGEVAVGVAAPPGAPEGPGGPVLVNAGGALLVLPSAGGALHVVETTGAGSAGLALEPKRSVDGARHLVEVGGEPPAETEVAAAGPGLELWRRACDRGAWGTAAVLLGVADRLVGFGAEHAKARVQFGKPIGSFQAVKHHLAGALVRLEFARPLVYAAAWALDEGDEEAPRLVSMAKSAASDAASVAASVALQVHGAIGYTWEHDLHLWMKRAWALGAAWGDAGWHRARLLGQISW